MENRNPIDQRTEFLKGLQILLKKTYSHYWNYEFSIEGDSPKDYKVHIKIYKRNKK